MVIGAAEAAPVIGDCITALEAEPEPEGREIILATCATDGTDRLARLASPRVQVLQFDEPRNLAQLRAAGIALARGDVVAVIDPFSLVQPGWQAAVLAAHAARPNLVIGGAVELAHAERQGLLAWAAYINEYGMFMPPVPAGPATILPGSNISYKRAALFDDADRPRHAEFWKTFVNWEVERAGSPLWLEPAMVVALDKPVAFGAFFRSRFDHGRCFAAMRSEAAPAAERWGRALTAPLLPVLLFGRWAVRYWAKGRRRGRLLATTPLQLALFASWAAGEAAGYLAGDGGSCARLSY